MSPKMTYLQILWPKRGKNRGDVPYIVALNVPGGFTGTLSTCTDNSKIRRAI